MKEEEYQQRRQELFEDAADDMLNVPMMQVSTERMIELYALALDNLREALEELDKKYEKEDK